VRTRVIVVDDDDVRRRGLAELLDDHPAIDVGGMLSRQAALAWAGNWDDVDVVIVDVAQEPRLDDRGAGVAVVEHVRRQAGPTHPVIIVVSGHFFDDGLRRRMREAAADFIYHRSEVQDTGALYSAVLHPDGARAGLPVHQTEEALAPRR
jgi:DNA-binding NarL/FixJ family response regulator